MYLYGFSNVTGFQVYDMEEKKVVAETSLTDVKARRKARSLYRKICLAKTRGLITQTMVTPNWDYITTHVSPLIVIVNLNRTKGILPHGSFRIKRDKERVLVFVDDGNIYSLYTKVDDITNCFTDDQLKRILPRIQPKEESEPSGNKESGGHAAR